MRTVTINIGIKAILNLDDDVTMDEIQESIVGLDYSNGILLRMNRMGIEDETVESFEVEDSR